MNILFVCTGNTCRSCMAEAIFNGFQNSDGLKAFSAGVHVVPGSKTSKNSSMVVYENLGVSIEDRNAVQLGYEHIEECHIVLTMTGTIKEILKNRYPEFTNKIFLVSEYAEVQGEIIDPYGGTIDTYKKTYEALKKCIDLIIRKIEKNI